MAKAKYTRLEYNVRSIENENVMFPPIQIDEVDDVNEDPQYLKMADEAYPNPVIIYQDWEGEHRTGDQVLGEGVPVYFDMMIIKSYV